MFDYEYANDADYNYGQPEIVHTATSCISGIVTYVDHDIMNVRETDGTIQQVHHDDHASGVKVGSHVIIECDTAYARNQGGNLAAYSHTLVTYLR